MKVSHDKKILLLMLLMAVLPAVAADQLVNIDFGNGTIHVGSAVIGKDGDIWNGVTNSGKPVLKDSSGKPTALSIRTNYEAQYSNDSANADAKTKTLVQDYFYANGKKTITIGGLDPGTLCTLYVIAGECGHDQRGGELSIDTDGDGNANDPRKVVPALYADAAFPPKLIENVHYAVFKAVVSQSGTVVLVSEPKNPDEGGHYWNNLMGLQLVIKESQKQIAPEDNASEKNRVSGKN